MCSFHVGIWAGGLILGGVINAFQSFDAQYALFVGLCVSSVITFIAHAWSFRRRFRNKIVAVATTTIQQHQKYHASETDMKAGAPQSTDHTSFYRVLNDDGTVEYRPIDKKDLQSENDVVSDLALNGGRDPNAQYT